MSRLAAIVLIGAAAAGGCRNVAGPLEARGKPKPDLPEFTIEEQERRARDKFALPEDDRRIGPPGFIDRPSPTGR